MNAKIGCVLLASCSFAQELVPSPRPVAVECDVSDYNHSLKETGSEAGNCLLH